MIYTVTFNPSLDYTVLLHEYQPGQVNRAGGEEILPGGKGINVSTILTNLGVDNIALGFVGGFTGAEIVRRVTELGCKTDFINLPCGMSRINVKIKANEESEINGIGPAINFEQMSAFYEKLEKLRDGDYLVLAGSVPSTLGNTVYMNIMEYLADKKINFVVDATESLLMNVLRYKPFLIKPNKVELGEMFGVAIHDNEEIVEYARKLIGMGARNVLISMAGDGAVLISEDGTVNISKAPKGKVVNSVGAGDSMVGGFIAGYIESGDYEHALKMGLAAGSASAFSKNLATKEEILKVYETIK